MFWHVISVGIWHSALYEGITKDIFVILFCSGVQHCSGAVSLTFGAARIVPVFDCRQLNCFFREEPPRCFEHKDVQIDVH